MKKILIVGIAIFSMFSCTKSADEFVIQGTVQGYKDGDMVFLKKVAEDMSQLIAIDTAVIKNNAFEFKSPYENLDLNYLQFGSSERIVPFVTEPGTILVEYDPSNPKANKISGTPNNDKYQEYTVKANDFVKRIADFQQENNQKLLKAQQENNTTLLNAIGSEYQKLNTEYVNYNKDFVANNKNAYISLYLLDQLTRSEVYDFDTAKDIFNSFSTDLKHCPIGANLDEFFNKGTNTAKNVAVGDKAPDFEAMTPEGKKEALYTNLGKITIIDFWASWCGPCRIENPQLVATYAKFKDKGLKIVGVSLDKDADKWKEAIAKDKLTWLQISNLKQWNDPIAKRYGVEGIPATFILDAEGKVIAKDLRGGELAAKLAELLK